jgi:hypothetical protein
MGKESTIKSNASSSIVNKYASLLNFIYYRLVSIFIVVHRSTRFAIPTATLKALPPRDLRATRHPELRQEF